MTIILFFLVLFILILVHEWGHFIVAKKTGMRVDEFGIGFPPKLFGKKWNGTEYTFNVFPIGGFVRIYGENAQDAAQDKSEGSNIEDSFTSKSKWAQAAVLIAGVTMNILFAWLLFVIIFMAGLPTAVNENEATDTAVLTVTHVMDEGPADIASLPLGAEITAISAGEEYQALLTPTLFKEFTQAHGDTPLTITYTHGGDEFITSIKPEVGIILDDMERPAVGVALSMIDTVRQPIHMALYEATKVTIHSLGAIAVGITTLFVDSVRGTADFSEVAGPIGIVGLVGDAAEFGFTSLMMFTAIISLNLAVINMLPIPALDGGRLVFVALEAVMRRPINPVWMSRVNFAGFALLMLLMLAVTWSDIAKLL
ncbi:MAG: regulator of sigma E protease [Acidimicrobiales bacterium]|jgi:regulator of sigma E protease